MYLHTGFGQCVNYDKVIAVSKPNSRPVKRLLDAAAADCKVIDHTQGRSTCSLIHMDSGHIILCHVGLVSLKKRIKALNGGAV